MGDLGFLIFSKNLNRYKKENKKEKDR